MTIEFKEKFDDWVCDGDSISVEIGPFTFTALVEHDPYGDSPDEICGFWPSKDPNNAGYVPPDKFDASLRRSKMIMDKYERGEWGYYVMCLEVESEEAHFSAFAGRLGGLEVNHPLAEDNSYLTDVANELLLESLHALKRFIKQVKEFENEYTI